MSQEIHSVILNLNSNFSNNKGSDFQVIVNKQLEIKPNTQVALYKGNIARKPIVLPSKTTLELRTKEAEYPSDLQVGLYDLSLNGRTLRDDLNTIDSTYPVGSIYPTLSVQLDAGYFSRLEFCRLLVNQMNNALQNAANNHNRQVTGFRLTNTQTNINLMFPYRFYYEQEGDNFFLGLRYHTELPDPENDLNFYENAITFEPLLTTLQSGFDNAVTFTGNIADTWNRPITASNKSNTWENWAIGNSPIKPQSYSSLYDEYKSINGKDISFAEAFVQCSTSNTTAQPELVFGFSNTYFLEKDLQSTNNPSTNDITGETGDVPILPLGAKFIVTKTAGTHSDSLIYLYASEGLFDRNYKDFLAAEVGRDAFYDRDLVLLAKIDPADYSLSFAEGIKARWVFYCENGLVDGANNPALLASQKYFFKFMVRSPYQQGGETILYDSKEYGLPIAQEAITSGYLFQQLKSPDLAELDNGQALSGGMQPVFMFNQSESSDWKVTGARANNVANLLDDTDTSFVLNLGTEGYRLNVPDTSPNAQALENILRVTTANSNLVSASQQSTFFNPNSYPDNPSISGVTSLGSDLTRYNIELNLPIKAYNNTENEANDIGQERTIVFNTDPVIEETGNFSAGLVNKNFVPPDVKFLSLNNPHSIKLNNIEVKIRNAKTNNIAQEISDAGLELVFRTEVAKKTSDQIDLVL
jgi:hypothetical protein